MKAPVFQNYCRSDVLWVHEAVSSVLCFVSACCSVTTVTCFSYASGSTEVCVSFSMSRQELCVVCFLFAARAKFLQACLLLRV